MNSPGSKRPYRLFGLSFGPEGAAYALLLLTGLLLFLPTLGGGFMLDDQVAIVQNRFIRSLDHLPLFFRSAVIDSSHVLDSSYRPLIMLSFALNYQLGGLDPLGYRLVNILFHLANGLLAFSLLNALLSLVSGYSREERVAMAFLAACFFLVHPVNALSVNFIWKRSGLMTVFFYLAAFRAFLGYRAGGRGAARYYFLTLFCALMAFLCKEIAATLVLVLMLADFIFIAGGRFSRFRGCLKAQLPFIALTACYILLWQLYFRQTAHHTRDPLAEQRFLIYPDSWRYMLTQCVVIPRYLGLLFLPLNTAVIHELPWRRSVADPAVLGGALLILLLLALALLLLRRRKVLPFGMLWFFIALAPTSSFIPLGAMDEHRLYLPSLGFGLVLAALWRTTRTRFCVRFSSRWGLAATLAAFGFLVALITGSVMRNSILTDEYRVLKRVLAVYPESHTALFRLARKYDGEGRRRAAVRAWRRLLKHHAGDHGAWNNLGTLYAELGFGTGAQPGTRQGLKQIAAAPAGKFLQGAEEAFTRANRLKPRNGRYHANLGLLYLRTGRAALARDQFIKALAFNPRRGLVHRYLALAYRGLGLPEKALDHFKRAISLGDNPSRKLLGMSP